ncbi:hypothetical protein ACP4OV_029088 [Aristida adscensionis]
MAASPPGGEGCSPPGRFGLGGSAALLPCGPASPQPQWVPCTGHRRQAGARGSGVPASSGRAAPCSLTSGNGKLQRAGS